MRQLFWLGWIGGMLSVGAASVFAEEAPPWKGNVEAAYINSTGNTQSETFLAAAKVERSFERSKLTGEAKGRYGQKNNFTSEKNWMLRAKYDRNLTPRLSLFALEIVERDVLKGIEIRYNTQGGLSYYFIKTASDSLHGEIGAGYVRENPISPLEDREYASGRVYGEYDHAFTDKTRFNQNIEYIPSMEEGKDYILSEETSFITNVMGNLAFKISYAIIYDNLPPPGFEKYDRLIKTSLLVTF